MPITEISRDWGSDPAMVRITTTDTLATAKGATYLTDQASVIEALNHGAFEWKAGDAVLLYHSVGTSYLRYDAATGALVDADDAGAIDTADIADGAVTTVKLDADAVDNSKLADNAVSLENLDAGITPSHIVVFAGQSTTVGGAAAEAFAVPGILATDLAFVQIVDDGTATVSVVQAVCTVDTLTVTFSVNPGNDAIFNYQILRAAT